MLDPVVEDVGDNGSDLMSPFPIVLIDPEDSNSINWYWNRIINYQTLAMFYQNAIVILQEKALITLMT